MHDIIVRDEPVDGDTAYKLNSRNIVVPLRQDGQLLRLHVPHAGTAAAQSFPQCLVPADGFVIHLSPASPPASNGEDTDTQNYGWCHRPVPAGSDGAQFPHVHRTVVLPDRPSLYATIWELS